MSQTSGLPALLRRVRAGEPEAAAEVMRVYGPHLQRVVRIELRDRRLRRALDTSDICQSVLASLFVRLALGQYEIDRPEQLLGLLARMARNKVAAQARKAYVVRREEFGATPRGEDAGDLVDRAPGPERTAAFRETLEAVRAELTEEERRLSELRAQGRAWSEIAAELGGHPDSLRIKLARALSRVTARLGLDLLDE
jgi:RNA polymerase sigma-70 factor (ECF subfamily)